MKLKNLILIATILFLGIGLGSCSSDGDRYVTGTLDKKVIVYTNNYGEIDELIRVSQSDIVFPYSNSSVSDIKYRGGTIVLEVGRGGFIGDLILEIDGTNMWTQFINLEEGVHEISDAELDEFYDELLYTVLTRGSANVYVDGVDCTRNTPLHVEFYLDIDGYRR